MKIISHVSKDLNNITIENPQAYDIISDAVSIEEEDDESGTLLQGLNGYAGGRILHRRTERTPRKLL